jgi:hypothetical protein
MGLSTFAMDSIAGRGIVSTVIDQSQLGRLNIIPRPVSQPRGPRCASASSIPIELLSWDSRVGASDALCGLKKVSQDVELWWGRFSGLYSALPNLQYDLHRRHRGQRPPKWNIGRLGRDRPLRRVFRETETDSKGCPDGRISDTWYAFDYPSFPSTPTVVQTAQTTQHCALKEEPAGTIINTATEKPFTYADACVGRNPHVAYSATATHATEEAVKGLLKTVFKMN